MQRRTFFTAMIAAAAMMALAACQMPAMNREVDQAAQRFYADLHDGHEMPGQNILGGDLANPATQAQLQQVRAIMPAGPPVSIRLQGQNFSTNSTGGHASLTHAYNYSDRTLIVETVFDKPPGAPSWRIIGFNINTQMPNGAAYRPPPNPASGPPAPAATPAAEPAAPAAAEEHSGSGAATPEAGQSEQGPAEEGQAEEGQGEDAPAEGGGK